MARSFSPPDPSVDPATATLDQLRVLGQAVVQHKLFEAFAAHTTNNGHGAHVTFLQIARLTNATEALRYAVLAFCDFVRNYPA